MDYLSSVFFRHGWENKEIQSALAISDLNNGQNFQDVAE